MEALDAALCEIVEQFRPVTVRQVSYQAVNPGLVPKSETKGYRVVQLRLVALREPGAIPHGNRGYPPTRPTRVSDTRAARVRRVHGTDSVELDAILPDELRKLVGDAIDGHMEPWRLGQFRMVEQEEREALRSMFGGAA